MLVHNPFNAHRHCFGLGEELAPYETREVSPGQEHDVTECRTCLCRRDGLPEPRPQVVEAAEREDEDPEE